MRNRKPEISEGLVERLLEGPAYLPHSPENEELFLRAVALEMAHNAEGNAFYARFLKRRGYDVHSVPKAAAEIPFLPVQVFKAVGERLFSVPDREIYASLSSSATSGRASTVVIDKVTAGRQRKAMMKVMVEFLGSRRRPFLVFDVDPFTSRGAALNARSAAIRAYVNFASESSFFIEETPAGLNFLAEEFAEKVASLDRSEPVVLCAFTYVLYGSVIRRAEESGLNYRLPAGSKIIHIGGWKKLESEKVGRRMFLDAAAGAFGVLPADVIDIYGFTEQMGLNYPDCPCGSKHTPGLSRVIVRDPETHGILPDGRAGALEFVSPLPHSYPGNAVLTDDLGVIDPWPCPFGRGGTRFRVIGRLEKAEARGCGDIMGARMRGAATAVAGGGEGLRLHYLAGGRRMESLAAGLEHLRTRREWLERQPVELLTGLINAAAGTWMANEQLARWRHQGLAFLARWCQGANLRRLVAESLGAPVDILDGFRKKEPAGLQLFKAFPKGLVCHWLAGNVPFLGMLALVQSMVSKNLNALKVSSRNTEALDAVLNTFAGLEYRDRAGRVIRGDDFLETVLLVYYDRHDREAALELSAAADARIAWGGREAIEAICGLPSVAGCEDIIFGPKSSFMVIAKEALTGERAVRKLMRRAATDVSSFDQEACASPHTIFIEEGGFMSPGDMAKMLGEYLEKALVLIPKAPESRETALAVQTARAVGYFLGECHHSQGSPGWTVLYDENVEPAVPVYSRVIAVKPVQDIMQAAALVHRGIQSIGLAAEGEKRLRFACEAAGRGAMRFPEIGRMTNFDSPWDGVNIIGKLTRVVSLGGPPL